MSRIPRIADDVLKHAIDPIALERMCCCDNFTTYDWECVKRGIGPAYAHIPLDDIRRQGINLRKKNGLAKMNGGHGAARREPVSRELQQWYVSAEFAEMRKICFDRAGHRCQVCNTSRGPLHAHHRSYHRMKTQDEYLDLICVCVKCHKACDHRRRIEAGLPIRRNKNGGDNNALFLDP